MVNVYEHPNISRGMKEPITLDGMKVFGPYTPGVKAGNQFWLSGQISIDQGDDIVSQTKGALAKIDATARCWWIQERRYLLRSSTSRYN
jgi:enamine deaminase RidA (YjgF/YER057c/UK114 family)